MPRRRSRYVLLVAFLMTFMLYQVFKNPEWDATSHTSSITNPDIPEQGQNAQKNPARPLLNNQPPPDSELPHDQEEGEAEQNPQKQTAKQTVKIPQLKTEAAQTQDHGIPTKSANTPTMPVWQPDAAAADVTKSPTEPLENDVHAKNPPGRPNPEHAAESKPTSTSQIHWHKVPEHFPVPYESVIPLPIGKAKSIPKIQHNFNPESDTAKEKREKRQAQVKAEMLRSWGGYRKHAWMHDELSPVSAGFRDPFCGWAATLVDGLDTLWIMGMKEEFDQAAQAVKKIDFTYSSTRRDIPVFETIIRYLGGLLAAYDVSGGKKGGYDMLLDKAVELAEILMGVFDTPNRMPILYYNWLPPYASQPHRASTVGVAELGSMTMEFTRLAQITGEDRYYDAIARITNAFEDLQNRGTTLNGIFPEHLDASGCNRSAEAIALNEAQIGASVPAAQSEPQGHKPPVNAKRDQVDVTNKVSEKPLYPGNRGLKATPKTTQTTEWDCVPQGLTPAGWGREQYSMGGSQDSTYEYFPKEYLMLGGLEPKYKSMHIKTVEAVKKWLLYRPMVPNDRDILFSAKVTTSGDPEHDQQTEYEVTHLTCFIGGMFGLGGKIFERPEDIEIAKRLTDGCVWAYESMPSGIMPEGASVVPCASTKSCPWNETIWWEHLDPSWDWRHRELQKWEERQRKKKAEKQQEELRREEVGKKGQQLRKREPLPPAQNIDSRRGTVQEVASNSLKDKLDVNSAGNSGIEKNPLASGGVVGEIPIPLDDELPDPRPLSHEEYVQNKLKSENLPPGFVTISGRRYILRPEAIESVWYMYRITGDPIWQEKGWKMWEAVIKATRTEFGASAIDDVTSEAPTPVNEMESFWIAETLKYFYLLFSTPDVISLDDWVLNTEAHPFQRPV